jgi:hypothetical protein
MGGTALTLTPGFYSTGGIPYNYKSALQTAMATPGTTYSILSTFDVAGNTQSQSNHSVLLDNTAPAAAGIQTANGGSTAGKAETGDTIVFTYSERIDPHSIVSGWTGSSTNVVVRLIDGGCVALNLLCEDDSFQIFNAGNSAALPLGIVNLNNHGYHGGGLGGTQPALTFGASGTASTMVQSGSMITITLGTASGSADTGSSTTMQWSPSTTAYDAAGNNASGSSINESGTSDREF